MKKTIQVLLWLFCGFVVFMIYKSVSAPFEFEKVKHKRFAAVISVLKDIRKSQEAHRTITGVFAPSFDSLIRFIDTAEFVITQQRDTSWMEYDESYRIEVLREKRVIDTLDFVSVKDSLFGNSDAYKKMMYVPGAAENVKFTMKSAIVDKAGFDVSVFEAKTAKNVVLEDQPKDLVIQENNVKNVEDIDGSEIIVGSLTEVSTTGNCLPYMTPKATNSHHSTIKNLSIQISSDGLSYCIEDGNSTINALKYLPLSKYGTLEQRMYYLSTEPLLDKGPFDTVNVIHKNNLCCFIPLEHFREEQLRDYLSCNIRLKESDNIAYDKLEKLEIVNVYVSFPNEVNYLRQRFKTIDTRHHHSILISKVFEKSHEEINIFLHLECSDFQLIIIENNKLKFYNSFYFDDENDFVYFLLFALNQINIDKQIVTVQFLGQVSSDNACWKIACKFLPKIAVCKYFNVFDDQIDKNLISRHLALVNSF